MTICYIGLGSNLGDSPGILHAVIRDLESSDGIVVLMVSSLYQTCPLENSDQPDYTNAVCSINTNLTAWQLLDTLQALEKKYGRVRTEKRWDSRTLDLDILLYGDSIIDDERLVIPHREMQYRDFVLFPLLEIAPGLTIPGLGSLNTLAAQCENRGMEKI